MKNRNSENWKIARYSDKEFLSVSGPEVFFVSPESVFLCHLKVFFCVTGEKNTISPRNSVFSRKVST